MVFSRSPNRSMPRAPFWLTLLLAGASVGGHSCKDPSPPSALKAELSYVCLDGGAQGCKFCDPYFARLVEHFPGQAEIVPAHSPKGLLLQVKYGATPSQVLVLSPEGSLEGVIAGCLSSWDLIRQVREYDSGEARYSVIAEEVRDDPRSTGALIKLFVAQGYSRQFGSQEETVMEIDHLDPDRSTVGGRFLACRETMFELGELASTGADIAGAFREALEQFSDEAERHRLDFIMALYGGVRAAGLEELEVECLLRAWAVRTAQWETTLRHLILSHPRGNYMHTRCDGL